MKNVNNLAEAKAKCFDDENCGMFTDRSNKGTYFYSCPFATKGNFGMLKVSRGSAWRNASVVYAKDPCEAQDCSVDGETCHKKRLGYLGAKFSKCKCGNETSCAQNSLAPT